MDYERIHKELPEEEEAPPLAKSASRSTAFECCYFPKRYIIYVLLFTGMIVVNAQRVNVGVTVVTILEKPTTGVASTTGFNDLSHLHWSNQMIGWLHSVFYVGILISQVPCGYLVTRFPSHRLFGGCILVTHLLNLLLPVSIEYLGYIVTCLIRLAQGLVEGLLYPSCYDILRHWSFPEEQSRAGAAALTGSYIGPTLGMVVSGLLADHWGWEWVFYVHGLAGVLWACVWFFLAYATPATHPTISVDEAKLIETKQGEAAIIYESHDVPWKEIFMSLPVWSLIVCNFARSSVFYMLLTNQPTYLHVFGFTIAENGLFSSLPHAFMALFCVISGLVADHLVTKPWISVTAVRKFFTCVGFGVEALFFYALAIIDDRYAIVVVLTIGVGISGLAISGWQINHLDLAPRYAGILVAITMTFGTLAGVTNPLIVAAMTQNQELSEWHNVFWMTGSILAFSVIFYAVFGTGERQVWASPKLQTVRIVNKTDPLESKPYGTFSTQLKLPVVKPEPTTTEVNTEIIALKTMEPDENTDNALKRRKSDATGIRDSS